MEITVNLNDGRECAILARLIDLACQITIIHSLLTYVIYSAD